jgi:hypothetical protein
MIAAVIAKSSFDTPLFPFFFCMFNLLCKKVLIYRNIGTVHSFRVPENYPKKPPLLQLHRNSDRKLNYVYKVIGFLRRIVGGKFS